MSSAEAFVAGLKRNCLLFHTHTPHVPAELQGGLPSSGCNFIAAESPAPQTVKPRRCWSAVCARLHRGVTSRSRQAAIKIN